MSMKFSNIIATTTLLAQSIVANTPASSNTILLPLVKKYQKKQKLPALAAIATYKNGSIEKATAGSLIYKKEQQADDKNRWHIGSITKSMTATVAAILVEEKRLYWNSTIAEVLPTLAAEIDTFYHSITLLELLSHSGGIIDNLIELPNWQASYTSTSPIREQRKVLIREMLQTTSKGEKGKFTYSNGGYILAGIMMEEVVDKTWEEIIQIYLFDKLGMSHAGFGAPKGEEPWGHQKKFFSYKPHNPEEVSSDNPPFLGPAGTIHVTLDDMQRYLNDHLQGRKGKGKLLSKESYIKLHTPIIAMEKPHHNIQYALGWNVQKGQLFHAGSNARWFAMAFIDIENDMTSFAVTNTYSMGAIKAVNKVLEKVSKKAKPQE